MSTPWSLHIHLSPLDGLIHVVPGPGARLVITVVPAGTPTWGQMIKIQAQKHDFPFCQKDDGNDDDKKKNEKIADSPIQKEARSPTGIWESTCAFSQ